MLKDVESVFAKQLNDGGSGPDPDPETDPELTNGSNHGRGGGPGPQLGVIHSRKDVIRTLEHICTYYKQHEPASPVPLLLKRAIRLVDKSFIEIIQDLAPESFDQIQRLRGESDADDS
jgi:type VI secretion system protein ImpA